MKKIRLDEAKPYVGAVGHKNMVALRLSGKEETGATKFWVGLSYFLPGGGMDYSGEDQPTDKVYMCLEGEVIIKTRKEEYILRPMDSIFIGPHEGREILNKTNKPASMLVIASY